MRPFDKFKEIDARLAALEAAIDALAKDPWPGAVPMESDDTKPLTTEQFRKILDSMPLAKPMVDAKPIASATIAPLPAKRRGRPPKTA